MNIRLIIEIIVAVLGLATATVVAIKTIKEAKLRGEVGLKPNPERCKEHADRLKTLEDRDIVYSQSLGELKADIRKIGKDVDTLLKLHLKG